MENDRKLRNRNTTTTYKETATYNKTFIKPTKTNSEKSATTSRFSTSKPEKNTNSTTNSTQSKPTAVRRTSIPCVNGSSINRATVSKPSTSNNNSSKTTLKNSASKVVRLSTGEEIISSNQTNQLPPSTTEGSLSLKSDNYNLRLSVSELNTKVLNLTKENQELKASLTLKQVNLNSSAEKFPNLEEAFVDLKSEFTEFKHQVDQLKSQNTLLQQAIEQLQADNERLQCVAALQLPDITITENTGSDIIDLRQTVIAENTELKSDLLGLRSEISQLKDQLRLYKESYLIPENGVSPEQQELNSNIIIRGVDLEEKVSKSELLETFNLIRSHLGVSEISEFEAVDISILQSNNHPVTSKRKTTKAKTIQVKFQSALHKRHFLQIRRTKKTILPSDIGINQKSKKPILIVEQLTKHNQELLYNARSLRTSSNFKFVWSNDGQILARLQQGSKVIRIKDTNHINQLKLQSAHTQYPNGCIHTNAIIQSNTSDPQV